MRPWRSGSSSRFWGAFVGFGLGAGLVASIAGERFRQTGLGWIVGIALALVFAVLAYLVYAVAVVITMGSIGFSLGASLMVALDVSWTWAILLGPAVAGVIAQARAAERLRGSTRDAWATHRQTAAAS